MEYVMTITCLGKTVLRIIHALCGPVTKWKFYCRLQFTKFTSMTQRNNTTINLLRRIPSKVQTSLIICPRTRNIEICLETSTTSNSIAPLPSEEDHDIIDQYAGINHDHRHECQKHTQDLVLSVIPVKPAKQRWHEPV